MDKKLWLVSMADVPYGIFDNERLAKRFANAVEVVEGTDAPVSEFTLNDTSEYDKQMAFDVLVDRRIDAIILSHDASLIEFHSGDDRFRFEAKARCCSESWFNHLSGLAFLLGRIIRDIIIKAEQQASGSRQKVDLVYGWTFVTAAGYVDLELRNSSNGYYSGYAERVPSEKVLSGRLVTEDF